jgi:hypothetical protein
VTFGGGGGCPRRAVTSGGGRSGMRERASVWVGIWQNGDFLVADGWRNHYSWGMCITSAECKTVITVVLTVMSGMDPHMIS